MRPDGWDKENGDDDDLSGNPEGFGEAGWPQDWAGPEYQLNQPPPPPPPSPDLPVRRDADNWAILLELIRRQLWMT